MLLSSRRKLVYAALLVFAVTTPVLAQPVPAPAAQPVQPVQPAAPPQPAAATPANAAPRTSVSTDDIEKLVATLKSDTDRAKLIAQLQAMIDAQRKTEQEPGLLTVITRSVSEGLTQMGDTLSEAGSQLSDFSGLWHWMRGAASDDDLRARLLEALARVAGVLGCGLIGMLIVRALLVRLTRPMLAKFKPRWSGKLAGAIVTFFNHATPLAAFAAAAFLAMPFLLARLHLHLNEIMVGAINAVLISGLLIALGRAVVQPGNPHLRVVPWRDETAHYFDVWMKRFVVTAVFGYMALQTAALLGLPHSAFAALQRLLGLLISVLLIVVILQNRQSIALWLRTTRGRQARHSSLRGRLADNWHLIAILYVLAVFAVWLLHPSAGIEFLFRATFLTALVVALAVGLETLVERLLNRVLALKPDLKARFPALEARANRYMPIMFGLLRIALALIVLLIVLRVWGFNSFRVLFDEPGRQIVGGLLRVIAIVIGAMIVWEVAGVALERYLDRTSRSGRLARARMKTMLPVARHLIGIVIIVLAALMLLSEIGIAIGPLLAGAGIVGLAIGLGAQGLVKDLIAGFSLIMEDALAVGDVVKIGDHQGTVEQLTIRSLRLRDGSGTVHHIPLGSVTIVENMTKDFAYALIDCKVQYSAKVDEVVQALHDVGESIAQDPALSDQVMAPMEVFGLEKFADGGYIVRGRLKTKPGAQWNVARAFNRRLKQVLDERQIAVNAPPAQMALGSDVVQALNDLRGIGENKAPDVKTDGVTAGPGTLKPA